MVSKMGLVLDFTVSRASNLLHYVAANFALTYSSSLALLDSTLT